MEDKAEVVPIGKEREVESEVDVAEAGSEAVDLEVGSAAAELVVEGI